MRFRCFSPGWLGALAVSLALAVLAGGQTLADLQSRFDHETNAVHKAKLMEKLGEAELAESRRADKAGDFNAVGLTMEKYRDNVRATVEALRKEHRDAEKSSNGYRQLEIHIRRAIRELDETLLVTPPPYQPPLQLVRQDLFSLDDELLKMLFPRRPADQPASTPTPTPEKQP